MDEEERYAQESFRERRVWRNIFIAGLVATAIICAFGWQLVAPRLEAAKKLDRAVSLVKQADSVLSDLDIAVLAAVATPDPTTASALAEQGPRVVAARAQLAEALSLIDAGHARLADEEQRMSDIVRTGVEARIAVADATPAIISAVKKAASDPSPENIMTLQTLVGGASSVYQSGKQKAAGADAALSAL